jgi:hypothetical protein
VEDEGEENPEGLQVEHQPKGSLHLRHPSRWDGPCEIRAVGLRVIEGIRGLAVFDLHGEPLPAARWRTTVITWRSAKETSQDSLQIPAVDDPHDRDDLAVNPIEHPLVPSPEAIQGKRETLQSLDLTPPREGGMPEGPHRSDERAPVLLGEGVEVCASVGREVDGELRHRTG